MSIIETSKPNAKKEISQIGITNDCLCDRGGLALAMRYIDHSGLCDTIAAPLEKYRTGNKGIGVPQLIRQVLGFLVDGTSRHLTWFDQVKQDPGFQAIMETGEEEMASSHQIKRFFSKMPKVVSSSFRAVLRGMFAQRLAQEKPQVVELFLDTMVMDNDDASCRQGSQPTYKKVKGFQPLQLIWDGQFVDAQFRGGSKNGNHDLTAFRMIKKAAKIIRDQLGYEVPIIVRMDGGFFDGELFWRLDVSGIGFVCSGRMTPEVKEAAAQSNDWHRFSKGNQSWSYCEFGTRCLSWNRFYRAIYLKPEYEDQQKLLEFARPQQVILTNIGTGVGLFGKVAERVKRELLNTENLIAQHHAKGADELTHRAFKDFGFQQLPFKRFGPNTTLYYLMLIAHNILECYKRDVLGDLVGKKSYATTVRRIAIDFAAKIVRTGGKTILKVTRATMNRLGLRELWRRCNQQRPLIT